MLGILRCYLNFNIALSFTMELRSGLTIITNALNNNWNFLINNFKIFGINIQILRVRLKVWLWKYIIMILNKIKKYDFL